MNQHPHGRDARAFIELLDPAREHWVLGVGHSAEHGGARYETFTRAEAAEAEKWIGDRHRDGCQVSLFLGDVREPVHGRDILPSNVKGYRLTAAWAETPDLFMTKEAAAPLTIYRDAARRAVAVWRLPALRSIQDSRAQAIGIIRRLSPKGAYAATPLCLHLPLPRSLEAVQAGGDMVYHPMGKNEPMFLGYSARGDHAPVFAGYGFASKPPASMGLEIGGAAPEPEFVFGDDVKPLHLSWLWEDVLLSGEFLLLAGEAKVGKSSIAAAIAASVSSGGCWPTGEPVEAGGVIYLETEDHLRKVTTPRLMAAGANMANIALTGDAFDLADDLRALNKVKLALEKRTGVRARLLVLSPVRMFFGVKESFNNVEVRRRLKLIQAWAESENVTVLGVHHPSSGSKFGGSKAWIEAARAGLFAERRGEARVMRPVGSNSGRDDWEIPYGTEAASPEGFNTSRIVWGEMRYGVTGAPLELSEGDASGSPAAASKLSIAMDWLAEALPVGSSELGSTLKRNAQEGASITETTLIEAARSLGVDMGQGGRGRAATWSR